MDELIGGPEATHNELDELQQQEVDLLMKLRETRTKITEAKQKLADFPKAIEDQTTKLKASAKHLAGLNKTLKPIPGTKADDVCIIDEVEQIRLHAISVIQNFLG